MITLNKVFTTMFKVKEAYESTVTISDNKYKELCMEFGTYSVDWYFTETGSIKYFDGKEWHICRRKI